MGGNFIIGASEHAMNQDAKQINGVLWAFQHADQIDLIGKRVKLYLFVFSS